MSIANLYRPSDRPAKSRGPPAEEEPHVPDPTIPSPSPAPGPGRLRGGDARRRPRRLLVELGQPHFDVCVGRDINAPVTLRLGYLTNLTHAPALVGVEDGYFKKNLPSNVTLQTATYNAGPAAVTALLAGSLDAAYLGPNSAITAYSQGKGAIRIISGATSGGAALVVNPSITAAGQLAARPWRRHSSATPRMSPCAPGCASKASPSPARTAAAGTSPSSPRTTRPRSARSRPARSPEPGSPSPGRRGWCPRATARSW